MINSIAFTSKPNYEQLNIKETLPKIKKEPIIDTNKLNMPTKEACDAQRAQLLMDDAQDLFLQETQALINKFTNGKPTQEDIAQASKRLMKLDKIIEKASYTGNSALSSKARATRIALLEVVLSHVTTKARNPWEDIRMLDPDRLPHNQKISTNALELDKKDLEKLFDPEKISKEECLKTLPDIIDRRPTEEFLEEYDHRTGKAVSRSQRRTI